MRKLIMLSMLCVVAMWSMAAGTDRTGLVKTGETVLSSPMRFTVADSINTGMTVNIDITAQQIYPAIQSVYLKVDTLGGTNSIAVQLHGKVFINDGWTHVEAAQTITNETAITITTATANRYRFFRVELVASGSAGLAHIETFEFKEWFTGGQLSVTSITDGTASFTAGALTGATTGAFSGNVTIGGTLVNTGLITANGGVTLGAGDDLIGSSTSDITINTDKFTVAGATGNTVIAGTLGVTGITSATGKISANGGISLITNSTVHWAKGGSTVLATSGTDKACSNGARYWVEIEIPYNVTITGLAYLIGSVGGTDSVVVQLCNSTGTEVATSRAVGGAAAIVGTAANFQSVPFTAPYAAVAGKYFAVVQFNGTTAKFRTYPIPGSKFITGTVAGVWGTAAGITPGSTFTADTGPILMTY